MKENFITSYERDDKSGQLILMWAFDVT